MRKIILIITILISLIPVVYINAQEYTLLEPLPCIQGVNENCDSSVLKPKISLDGYILYIYKFSIALAVFLAIIRIIWGGFLYITSETPFKIADGKSKIQSAIIGLTMVLVSYLILLTIDPRLVNIDTNIPILQVNKSDLDAVRNFQRQLEQDIKNLSVENQNKIRDFNNRIDILKERQNELDKKFQLHEIDDEEYEIESAKIEREQILITLDKNKTIIQDVGSANFARVVNILGDLEGYTKKAEVTAEGKYFQIENADLSSEQEDNLKEIINTIKLKYDEYIKDIEIYDPETSQLLEKQKNFYLSEIEYHTTISKNVVVYKNIIDSKERADLILKDILKPHLNKQLSDFKKELENPQKGDAVGLKDEYKKLLEQRINILESVLGSN